MNKYFTLSILCLFSFLSLASENAAHKVLISKVIDHPAIDSTIKGVIAGLKENGFEEGKNLDLKIESAQGSPALASQIASKFAQQNPEVVVGVGTLSAQSFIKYAKEDKVNLIYTTVTDPVTTGLMQQDGNNNKNITGVSNFVPLEPQLSLFKKIQPNLKKLGIIYNPGEINSVSIANNLDQIAHIFGIEIVKKTANKTVEVSQAAASLAHNVDAIYISNDNTALAAISAIVKAANEQQIPVYVSDTDIVKKGALAAFGANQYIVGYQTGKMIAKILEKVNINSIRPESPEKIDLVLNLDAANLLNIQIPEDLQNSAIKLIGSKK